MKVYSDIGLLEFEPWSGAVATKDMIVEAGKCDEFDQLIEEIYPDGINETQLNDILWFEDEWLCEALGLECEND